MAHLPVDQGHEEELRFAHLEGPVDPGDMTVRVHGLDHHRAFSRRQLQGRDEAAVRPNLEVLAVDPDAVPRIGRAGNGKHPSFQRNPARRQLDRQRRDGGDRHNRFPLFIAIQDIDPQRRNSRQA